MRARSWMGVALVGVVACEPAPDGKPPGGGADTSAPTDSGTTDPGPRCELASVVTTFEGDGDPDAETTTTWALDPGYTVRVDVEPRETVPGSLALTPLVVVEHARPLAVATFHDADSGVPEYTEQWTYTYDDVGRVLVAEGPDGTTTSTWEGDQLVETRWEPAADGAPIVTTFVYDGSGNRVELHATDGQGYEHHELGTFDGDRELRRDEHEGPVQAEPTRRTTWTYDDAGRLVAVERDGLPHSAPFDGTTDSRVTLSYDVSGVLTGIERDDYGLTADGVVDTRWTYLRDPEGVVLALEEDIALTPDGEPAAPPDGTPDQTCTYTWDAAGRLEAYACDAGADPTSYEHRDDGQLTAWTKGVPLTGGATASYTFSEDGCP